MSALVEVTGGRDVPRRPGGTARMSYPPGPSTFDGDRCKQRVTHMQIESIKALEGPNVHSHRPVLVMTLDLQDLAGRETRDFPGFNERLLELLPGLHDHVCGLGYPGGLVERLHGGTYFGHVIEHIALELSGPAGVPVNFGRTRQTERPSVYHLIVEYRSAAVMRLLLETAVEIADCLARGEDYAGLEARLAEAR